MVEITDLNKHYIQGHERITVLQNINFSMKPGEFAALLGPSGSGKSTLLNMIGLLDEPSAGTLRLFGQEAAGLGEKEKANLRLKKIGFVFQFDSLLPEFTLLENVEMPARLAGCPDAGAAMAMLKHFGLAALAGRTPSELSGGEKQRGALARAMRNSPAILLADEPTGNLDRHNAKSVLNDLKALAEAGTSVLMVTHNEEAARNASRVFHLADGMLTPL
ncbi:MAG: ABC transporter ATP-binding protein [bacterium]